MHLTQLSGMKHIYVCLLGENLILKPHLAVPSPYYGVLVICILSDPAVIYAEYSRKRTSLPSKEGLEFLLKPRVSRHPTQQLSGSYPRELRTVFTEQSASGGL